MTTKTHENMEHMQRLEALVNGKLEEKDKQIRELQEKLKQTEQDLDVVLDIADERGLSMANYLLFISKNNLAKDFKQFLIENKSK